MCDMSLKVCLHLKVSVSPVLFQPCVAEGESVSEAVQAGVRAGVAV